MSTSTIRRNARPFPTADRTGPRARFRAALRAACFLAWAAGCPLAEAQTSPAGETRLKLGPPPTVAFARAKAPRAFELPRDHGPHFEFQTEWWYYTGNLATDDGRRFGFQLTFFRRGLSPGVAHRRRAWPPTRSTSPTSR